MSCHGCAACRSQEHLEPVPASVMLSRAPHIRESVIEELAEVVQSTPFHGIGRITAWAIAERIADEWFFKADDE